MPFTATNIEGLMVFEPKVWGDYRGYFFESYNENTFKAAGIDVTFVQDNEAKSSAGVLRGLHYQIGPLAMAKLVRVVEGEVLDVVVDIREDSATYGESFSILLSAENKKQLFVPRGFAHGYVCLSETVIFCYKCDNFYSRIHEGGIIYNDPSLNIDWKLPAQALVISEKDHQLPLFGQHRKYISAEQVS
jgi:dTDP-4-dehydrorhamnose 3,5-epimerase